MTAFRMNIKLGFDSPTHDPSIDTFKIEYLLGPPSFYCWYSTTHSSQPKFSGHFLYISNLSPFSPSCSCCSILARRRQLQRTIWLLWVFIVLCTFPTGYIGMHAFGGFCLWSNNFALQILYGRRGGSHSCHSWTGANRALPRLLLRLLYKVGLL
jgi:nitrate reductase NapE component